MFNLVDFDSSSPIFCGWFGWFFILPIQFSSSIRAQPANAKGLAWRSFADLALRRSLQSEPWVNYDRFAMARWRRDNSLHAKIAQHRNHLCPQLFVQQLSRLRPGLRICCYSQRSKSTGSSGSHDGAERHGHVSEISPVLIQVALCVTMLGVYVLRSFGKDQRHFCPPPP